jgi:hypothetical protein
MSFDLVDKDGGEIKCTAWNDQVDMFQDMIQVCTHHMCVWWSGGGTSSCDPLLVVCNPVACAG